jgi:hypothetical protein
MSVNGKQRLLDDIDDYQDSVFAIIGFANFYRFDDDTKTMRNDVLVFQGRRLTPSAAKAINSDGHPVEFVTPDVGVLLTANFGVLAEVKKSFPTDENLWLDDFKQLMAYDDDLTGWPSTSGSVSSHDVVLLVHLSRGKAICKYFEKNRGGTIHFQRPFCIVEFNRSNERQAYFFFRTATGKLTNAGVDAKLENGVQVPMLALTKAYSEVKIYDHEPPLAYMLHLIWEQVINTKASGNPKYARLAKRQRIDVEVSVNEVVNELHEKFSFHQLHRQTGDRQPKIPKQEWVQRAFDGLVKAGDAVWLDRTKGTLKAKFTRFDDVLAHFVELCAADQETSKQLTLDQYRSIKN